MTCYLGLTEYLRECWKNDKHRKESTAMNKDEVIALAEKCKLAVLIHSQWTHEIREFTVVDYVVEGDLGSLMQFADLVANAEREACEPQRTWVGLTGEERNALLHLTITHSAIDFAKACEAKLKEKNT